MNLFNSVANRPVYSRLFPVSVQKSKVKTHSRYNEKDKKKKLWNTINIVKCSALKSFQKDNFEKNGLKKLEYIKFDKSRCK